MTSESTPASTRRCVSSSDISKARPSLAISSMIVRVETPSFVSPRMSSYSTAKAAVAASENARATRVARHARWRVFTRSTFPGASAPVATILALRPADVLPAVRIQVVQPARSRAGHDEAEALHPGDLGRPDRQGENLAVLAVHP